MKIFLDVPTGENCFFFFFFGGAVLQPSSSHFLKLVLNPSQ